MVKVPARPGLDLSRVRSDNPSGQPKDPSRVRSVRASAYRGFVRSLPRSAKGLFRQGLGPSRVRSVTLPRSAKGRSVKVPARPGLGPSKVRSVRASARRSSFPRESHPVKSRPARASARRSSSPGGSPHPSTSGSPPHLFPFPPPSCPPPLLYRSGASYPSDAPPLHPAFRCG